MNRNPDPVGREGSLNPVDDEATPAVHSVTNEADSVPSSGRDGDH